MKKAMIKTASGLQGFTLMLLCLTLFGLQLNAQKPGGGAPSAEERATRLTEMMKSELDLTAAQEPKVKAINLKYAQKMQDVRKISDTAAQRKSFESLNKQKDAELKPVLTASQFKTYQKLMAEYLARRKQGRN
jgi:Spy/CpxP family protein refolding chaperone